MPVPTLITDLSTTIASNSPGGGDTPADGDNHIRSLAAFIASIMANSGNGWTSPYATTGALAALPTLSNGTYTPTLTDILNIGSSGTGLCRYSRIGATVTVSGAITIDPTTSGVSTQVDMSLPVASDFTLTTDAAGVVAVASLGVSAPGYIVADATNNRVSLFIYPPSASSQTYRFAYQYEIK